MNKSERRIKDNNLNKKKTGRLTMRIMLMMIMMMKNRERKCHKFESSLNRL